ncbi:Pns7-1 [Oat sterile dwarf virus]|uniref:Pns7-1 n=2 Tax=Fijivirus TaxID=10988 RepID=O70784_9REOV|nr:Pns7-1 [Oat sterile dwarf virus]BAA25148.1 Pns7-1 [Oat sterile dwarf virus]
MERSSRETTDYSYQYTKTQNKTMKRYKDSTADTIAYGEIQTCIGVNAPAMALSDYLTSVAINFASERPLDPLEPELYHNLNYLQVYPHDVDLNEWMQQFMCATEDCKSLSINLLCMISTLYAGNAYIENGHYRYESKTQRITQQKDYDSLAILSRAAKMVLRLTSVKGDVVRDIQRWLIRYFTGKAHASLTISWSPNSLLPKLHDYSTNENLLTYYYRTKLRLYNILSNPTEIFGGNVDSVYTVIFLQYAISHGRHGTASTPKRFSELINTYALPNINPAMALCTIRKPSVGLIAARGMLTTVLIRGYSPCLTPYVYIIKLETEHPFQNSLHVTDGSIRTEDEVVEPERELVDVENLVEPASKVKNGR